MSYEGSMQGQQAHEDQSFSADSFDSCKAHLGKELKLNDNESSSVRKRQQMVKINFSAKGNEDSAFQQISQREQSQREQSIASNHIKSNMNSSQNKLRVSIDFSKDKNIVTSTAIQNKDDDEFDTPSQINNPATRGKAGSLSNRNQQKQMVCINFNQREKDPDIKPKVIPQLQNMIFNQIQGSITNNQLSNLQQQLLINQKMDVKPIAQKQDSNDQIKPIIFTNEMQIKSGSGKSPVKTIESVAAKPVELKELNPIVINKDSLQSKQQIQKQLGNQPQMQIENQTKIAQNSQVKQMPYQEPIAKQPPKKRGRKPKEQVAPIKNQDEILQNQKSQQDILEKKLSTMGPRQRSLMKGMPKNIVEQTGRKYLIKNEKSVPPVISHQQDIQQVSNQADGFSISDSHYLYLGNNSSHNNSQQNIIVAQPVVNANNQRQQWQRNLTYNDELKEQLRVLLNSDKTEDAMNLIKGIMQTNIHTSDLKKIHDMFLMQQQIQNEQTDKENYVNASIKARYGSNTSQFELEEKDKGSPFRYLNRPLSGAEGRKERIFKRNQIQNTQMGYQQGSKQYNQEWYLQQISLEQDKINHSIFEALQQLIQNQGLDIQLQKMDYNNLFSSQNLKMQLQKMDHIQLQNEFNFHSKEYITDFLKTIQQNQSNQFKSRQSSETKFHLTEIFLQRKFTIKEIIVEILERRKRLTPKNMDLQQLHNTNSFEREYIQYNQAVQIHQQYNMIYSSQKEVLKSQINQHSEQKKVENERIDTEPMDLFNSMSKRTRSYQMSFANNQQQPVNAVQDEKVQAKKKGRTQNSMAQCNARRIAKMKQILQETKPIEPQQNIAEGIQEHPSTYWPQTPSKYLFGESSLGSENKIKMKIKVDLIKALKCLHDMMRLLCITSENAQKAEKELIDLKKDYSENEHAFVHKFGDPISNQQLQVLLKQLKQLELLSPKDDNDTEIGIEPQAQVILVNFIQAIQSNLNFLLAHSKIQAQRIHRSLPANVDANNLSDQEPNEEIKHYKMADKQQKTMSAQIKQHFHEFKIMYEQLKEIAISTIPIDQTNKNHTLEDIFERQIEQKQKLSKSKAMDLSMKQVEHQINQLAKGDNESSVPVVPLQTKKETPPKQVKKETPRKRTRKTKAQKLAENQLLSVTSNFESQIVEKESIIEAPVKKTRTRRPNKKKVEKNSSVVSFESQSAQKKQKVDTFSVVQSSADKDTSKIFSTTQVFRPIQITYPLASEQPVKNESQERAPDEKSQSEGYSLNINLISPNQNSKEKAIKINSPGLRVNSNEKQSKSQQKMKVKININEDLNQQDYQREELPKTIPVKSPQKSSKLPIQIITKANDNDDDYSESKNSPENKDDEDFNLIDLNLSLTQQDQSTKTANNPIANRRETKARQCKDKNIKPQVQTPVPAVGVKKKIGRPTRKEIKEKKEKELQDLQNDKILSNEKEKVVPVAGLGQKGKKAAQKSEIQEEIFDRQLENILRKPANRKKRDANKASVDQTVEPQVQKKAKVEIKCESIPDSGPAPTPVAPVKKAQGRPLKKRNSQNTIVVGAPTQAGSYQKPVGSKLTSRVAAMKSQQQVQQAISSQDLSLDISLDPNQRYSLVPCESYPSFETQPYRIYFTFEVQMVMYIHSYLSKNEVIGLLGGNYYDTEIYLPGQVEPVKYLVISKIYTAESCIKNSNGRQKNCEISDEEQVKISNQMEKDKVQKLAWYHSHPIFEVDPSVQDLWTHYTQQNNFSREGKPFFGVIVGPYWKSQDVTDTLFMVFNLKEVGNNSRMALRPSLSNLKERARKFQYKIIPNTKLKYSMYSDIKKMIQTSSTHKCDRPDMVGEWTKRRGISGSKFSYKEKFMLSLKKVCEDNLLFQNNDLISEIRNNLVGDIDRDVLDKQLSSHDVVAPFQIMQQQQQLQRQKQQAKRIANFEELQAWQKANATSEGQQAQILQVRPNPSQASEKLREGVQNIQDPQLTHELQQQMMVYTSQQQHQSQLEQQLQLHTYTKYFSIGDSKKISKYLTKIEQALIKEFSLNTQNQMEQTYQSQKQKEQESMIQEVKVPCDKLEQSQSHSHQENSLHVQQIDKIQIPLNIKQLSSGQKNINSAMNVKQVKPSIVTHQLNEYSTNKNIHMNDGTLDAQEPIVVQGQGMQRNLGEIVQCFETCEKRQEFDEQHHVRDECINSSSFCGKCKSRVSGSSK